MEPLKTALYDDHLSNGGRIVDFSGWALPVQYTSILDEHMIVRNEAGVFDTSHMGEFFCEGPDTFDFLNYLVSNDLSKIESGGCLYSPMLNENGTVVDDLIIYLFSKEKAMVVVNASNIEKDLNWFKKIKENKNFTLEINNLSNQYSMLALQGPSGPAFIDSIFPGLISGMKGFTFKEIPYRGKKIIFSTTGYTGERGGEFYLPNEIAPDLFKDILESGAKPCGLGARDSLRLEKGYSLYGHELTETINVLDAGLGWTVSMDKTDFVGKSALKKYKESGVINKLIGFKMKDKSVARQGAEVLEGEKKIGEVTSGTFSPSLKLNIGLAFVPKDYNQNFISLKIRNRIFEASVEKRIFI